MERLIEHIKRETKVDDITLTTPLLEKKILDSLQLIQLIAFIESSYGITIKAEDLVPEHFQTVNSMMGLINRSKG